MAETYGQLIARRRNELGWTQEVLADRSGVRRRTIQAIEAGETDRPQRATKLALNDALEIEGTPPPRQPDIPEDVEYIVAIVTTHLVRMGPTERLKWLRDVTQMDSSGHA